MTYEFSVIQNNSLPDQRLFVAFRIRVSRGTWRRRARRRARRWGGGRAVSRGGCGGGRAVRRGGGGVRAELAEWEAADGRPERAGLRCQEEGMAAADQRLRRDRVAAAPEGLFPTRMLAAETSINLKRHQRLNHLLRGQERVCRPSLKARKLGPGQVVTKAFLILRGKPAVASLRARRRAPRGDSSQGAVGKN